MANGKKQEENKFYEIIAQKASNLILQNKEAIERDLKENLKVAEEPEKMVMPITLKINIAKYGDEYNFKESIEWEVKAKKKIETEADSYNPLQPELPLKEE